MGYLLIASMWIAYCLLHSFLVSTTFTGLVTRLFKNYYAFYRMFFVILSLALLIPLISYTDQFDASAIIAYTPTQNIIRYILLSGSLIVFFWAFFFSYDPLSFFGIRQILNFGKIKNINPSEDLRRDGLLGVVRHPMYFGLIISLWCVTFTMADVIVNIILTSYVVMGTILEERKLVLEFGDAYVKYQREVPMLIPFIK